MLTTQRKQFILDKLKAQGQVVARELSIELGISEDTVRRDLRELSSGGLLMRVHGGALPASPAVADFTRRKALSNEAKQELGQTGATLVRDGQVIIVDGGTTNIQLVRHFPRQLRATVITHSPHIALELVEYEYVEVILIGGRLFKHSIVTVGASAMETIGRIRADVFFMGITGVHAQAGLTTGDLEEAYIKQALSRAAAETFVLASEDKINTASPYLIMPLEELSGLIVPSGISDQTLAGIAAHGTRIIKSRS